MRHLRWVHQSRSTLCQRHGMKMILNIGALFTHYRGFGVLRNKECQGRLVMGISVHVCAKVCLRRLSYTKASFYYFDRLIPAIP